MHRLSSYPFPADGLVCYYHTASVRNAIDIIRNAQLFASLPSRVNDPADLKLNLRGCLNSSYLGDALVRNAFSPNCLDLLSAQTISDASAESVARKTLIDKVYRFVCFATADKVDVDKRSAYRFWNEYAGHFKGVRFKFKISNSFTRTPQPEKVLCDFITYGVRSAELDLSNLNSSTDIFTVLEDSNFLDCFAYTKSQKWSGEFEFRIGTVVKYLSNVISEITKAKALFFDFDMSHLLEVCVGEDATAVDKQKLLQEASRLGIQVKEASRDCRSKQITYKHLL